MTKPLTLQQKMLAWARGKAGQQVDRGECTDLVDGALSANGGKTLYQLGESDQQHPDEKKRAYVWGEAIALKDAVAGDILQFADHAVSIDVTVTVKSNDGTEIDDADGSYLDEVPRTHHTAIVETAPAGGVVKTLEQNVDPDGKVVQKLSLPTKGSTTRKVESKMMEHPTTGKQQLAKVTTVRIVSITGSVQAYRPTPQ